LSDAELWEELIEMAKNICDLDQDPLKIWAKACCEVKRVHLKSEDWHQVPHSGAPTPE